jgi:hypothetical protein
MTFATSEPEDLPLTRLALKLIAEGEPNLPPTLHAHMLQTVSQAVALEHDPTDIAGRLDPEVIFMALAMRECPPLRTVSTHVAANMVITQKQAVEILSLLPST